MSQHQRKEDEDLELSEETPIIREEPPLGPTMPTSTGRYGPAPSDRGAPRMPRTVRRCVAPLLPPPVLRAMDRADALLLPYAGDDGSVKVVGTGLLAYLVLIVTRLLSRRVLGRGPAVADDEAEELQGGSDEYEQTVLLCGPASSGKTRLFYQLCYDAQHVDTVSSIKPNVAVVHGIRYMDWPGHAKLTSPLLRPILLPQQQGGGGGARPRVVVVLDATQPVASAADCLHQLFSTYHREYTSGGSSNQHRTPAPVLVLCHKSDLPSAKNEKRLQLQLRGELERLLQSQAGTAPGSSGGGTGSKTPPDSPWWPVGEPLDLSALPFVTLLFRSSTCEGKGCKELVQEFCRTGSLRG